MARLQVRRLAYALGAEVRGVDLRLPLDEATLAEIRQTWLEHLLLCFPDQLLDSAQLVAFSRYFGEVDDNPNSKTRDPQNSQVIQLTNKAIGGRPFDGYKQGQSWHSDRSYTMRPTPRTFVLAKEVPAYGGDTMFANQYMAYETLSPKLQEILGGLNAIHDGMKIKGYEVQSPEVIEKHRAAYPLVVHPVVKVHPETQRKALYVGDRVRGFEAMTVEESAPLLDYLVQHATRYEFVYRHRWKPNDLVAWDNRCLMHLAISDYDLYHDVRHLIRTSLSGESIGRPAVPVPAG